MLALLAEVTDYLRHRVEWHERVGDGYKHEKGTSFLFALRLD